jgi:hypothetical protein
MRLSKIWVLLLLISYTLVFLCNVSLLFLCLHRYHLLSSGFRGLISIINRILSCLRIIHRIIILRKLLHSPVINRWVTLLSIIIFLLYRVVSLLQYYLLHPHFRQLQLSLLRLPAHSLSSLNKTNIFSTTQLSILPLCLCCITENYLVLFPICFHSRCFVYLASTIFSLFYISCIENYCFSVSFCAIVTG